MFRSEYKWPLTASPSPSLILPYSDGAHSYGQREHRCFIWRQFNSQRVSAEVFLVWGFCDHSNLLGLTMWWEMWKQLSVMMSSSKSWSRRKTMLSMDKNIYQNICFHCRPPLFLVWSHFTNFLIPDLIWFVLSILALSTLLNVIVFVVLAVMKNHIKNRTRPDLSFWFRIVTYFL